MTVALNSAQQAAKMGVKRFIHLSTAQVYNSDKVIVLLSVGGMSLEHCCGCGCVFRE